MKGAAHAVLPGGHVPRYDRMALVSLARDFFIETYPTLCVAARELHTGGGWETAGECFVIDATQPGAGFPSKALSDSVSSPLCSAARRSEGAIRLLAKSLERHGHGHDTDAVEWYLEDAALGHDVAVALGHISTADVIVDVGGNVVRDFERCGQW